MYLRTKSSGGFFSPYFTLYLLCCSSLSLFLSLTLSLLFYLYLSVVGVFGQNVYTTLFASLLSLYFSSFALVPYGKQMWILLSCFFHLVLSFALGRILHSVCFRWSTAPSNAARSIIGVELKRVCVFMCKHVPIRMPVLDSVCELNSVYVCVCACVCVCVCVCVCAWGDEERGRQCWVN